MEEIRVGNASRRAIDRGAGLARCAPTNLRRTTGKSPPISNRVLSQFIHGPVALLRANARHDAEEHRLEDVSGYRIWPRARHAIRSSEVRPMAMLLGLWRRHVY